MDPNGKVALNTGGGSGIGRATALALAKDGASIVIADVNADGARESVRLLEGAGGKAASVQIDVTKRDDIERMVAFAEGTFGGIDIFHNNAGVGTPQPRFPAAKEDLWERTLNIDLWAVIAGVQAVVPAMQRRGGGVIVNTASLAGLVAYDQDPIYAATKHGVVGLTRALAFLKDEANIRVNCVCPGFVDTPLPRRRLDSMTGEERARWESVLARIPMIPPSEVADAVLEIVRDDSLTGQVMALQYGQPRRLVPPSMSLM